MAFSSWLLDIIMLLHSFDYFAKKNLPYYVETHAFHTQFNLKILYITFFVFLV